MFADIVTPRLRLRRLRQDDVRALLAYRSDPEVGRYQVWSPETEREVADFVAEQFEIEPDLAGTWFQLAIALRAADGPWQAEVGITLAPWAQGRGYAREALATVFDFLFDGLGKHRVVASADPRNEPSVRLLERLGMRREAHFREAFWGKGEWCDDLVYGILADEWRASRKSSEDATGGPVGLGGGDDGGSRLGP